MTSYRVSDGTQVHHEGVLHGAGEVLQVSAEVAEPWLAAGWVRPVDTKSPPSAGRASRGRA